METLISTREIGPLSGFRSKMGRAFNAIVRLTDDYEMKFDFGNEADQAQEKVDFSAQQPLGKCPQCGHSVYEHKLLYVCEKSVGAGASCSFRTGKIILNRAIEAEQVVKLLQTGRTDLLAGFVSRKGRPFSAYLVVGPAGKIGFEFEQKKTKSKPADTVPETGKAAS